jgi:hypothetical protein
LSWIKAYPVKEIEYDLLESAVIYMEKEGVKPNLVIFNIDHQQIEDIYDNTGREYSIDQLEKAADYCIVHGLIDQRSISDQYTELRLTEKGIGIIRSKRKQQEILRNRSLLKKLSDFIEEHKGLFVFLSATIALITLILSIFGCK